MDRTLIHEGMTVRSRDGEKLGKVISCKPDTFVVESGFFFPKDYSCQYDYVSRLDNEEVILGYSADQVRRNDFSTPSEPGWRPGMATTRDEASRDMPRSETMGSVNEPYATKTPTQQPYSSATGPVVTPVQGTYVGETGERAGKERMTTAPTERMGMEGRREEGWTDKARMNLSTEEIRVPLSDEEVMIEKHVHDAGEVRVRKHVVTENRHFTVPVEHEEVEIERVQTPTSGLPTEAEGLFRDETITVRLHEEEVDFMKRPVVREEICLRKQVLRSDREADTTIRHETADIERDTTYVHDRGNEPGKAPTT